MKNKQIVAAAAMNVFPKFVENQVLFLISRVIGIPLLHGLLGLSLGWLFLILVVLPLSKALGVLSLGGIISFESVLKFAAMAVGFLVFCVEKANQNLEEYYENKKKKVLFQKLKNLKDNGIDELEDDEWKMVMNLVQIPIIYGLQKDEDSLDLLLNNMRKWIVDYFKNNESDFIINSENLPLYFFQEKREIYSIFDFKDKLILIEDFFAKKGLFPRFAENTFVVSKSPSGVKRVKVG